VTIFNSDKCSGLDGTCQRGLERNITVHGKWEAMNNNPTTNGRSFPGLSIATFNTAITRIRKY
jgi:hypothetical protein